MYPKIIRCSLFLTCLTSALLGSAQPFYFGADLSYVNEMEDCGVVYMEGGKAKDVYQIFSDHQVNLIRLRLWHTPSWYDNLNDGNRYSDFADVKRAIARAKAEDMDVLLDFHLSDNWADPGKQVIPAAWAPVVDDLPVLMDTLYNYIHSALTQLHSEDLLPEMVQIGNETNRGILLSQAVNDAGWTLNWDRNSQLFNRAINAVRDVEIASGKDIVIALHVADPVDAVWLFDQFIDNGVTDFDVMGISYYWAWHQPTTIAQTGAIIQGLMEDHSGYEVMIFETGYMWTTASNDNANNIINSTHPAYAPASPDNQRRWLEDLTQEVINSGGTGVIYWEPAWVSSPCRTQWGQGSHQEHATFFDFDNNLLGSGGMEWPEYPYENLSGVIPKHDNVRDIEISVDTNEWKLNVVFKVSEIMNHVNIMIVNVAGQTVFSADLEDVTQPEMMQSVSIPELGRGVYFAVINSDNERICTTEFVIVATK